MTSSPSLKPKVTVKLTPTLTNDTSPAPSRPSSRNSVRASSRPASPTKSFVSASSPLARPKAKVNRSAIRKTPSSSSAATTTPSRLASAKEPHSPSARSHASSSSPATRPASPVKLTPRLRDGALSPPVRAQPTIARVRPSSVSSSTPQAPELRHRSLTASSDALRSPLESRRRQGSVALHHTASFSNLQVGSRSPVIGPSNVAHSELAVPSDTELDSLAAPAPIKIRSKVTAMAKNTNDASSSPPTPDPVSRPVKLRTRAPSISSGVSFMAAASSPPLPLYPITTATPAANPHRYAPPRTTTTTAPRSTYIPSSPSQQPTKSYHPQDEFRPFAKTMVAVTAPPSINIAKIDPASVPLPPQSPPISALSISSRSSVSISRTSASYIPEPGTSPESPVSVNSKWKPNGGPQSLRNTLDSLVAYASAQENEPASIEHEGTGGLWEEDKERKVKAEAKSNRKIADLEITNRSLLAINASLEKTKDRQAKEIRELKRKLRESRLILPPPTFRAVKSSLDPDDADDDEEDLDSDSSSSSDHDENRVGGSKLASDETYRRIKLMLESLLDSGRRALERTAEDFIDTKGGAKVLTAEEVETWRDESGHVSDLESRRDDEEGYYNHLHSPTPQPEIITSTTTSPSNGLIGLGFGTWTLAPPSNELSSPKPPPILITESA